MKKRFLIVLLGVASIKGSFDSERGGSLRHSSLTGLEFFETVSMLEFEEIWVRLLFAFCHGTRESRSTPASEPNSVFHVEQQDENGQSLDDDAQMYDCLEKAFAAATEKNKKKEEKQAAPQKNDLTQASVPDSYEKNVSKRRRVSETACCPDCGKIVGAQGFYNHRMKHWNQVVREEESMPKRSSVSLEDPSYVPHTRKRKESKK